MRLPPKEGEEMKHRSNEGWRCTDPRNLGGQLAEVLHRFGIEGPIVGMNADGSDITVTVGVVDPFQGPLIDRDDDAMATIQWTAKLNSGASKQEIRKD
jgi:hypothetical protein